MSSLCRRILAALFAAAASAGALAAPVVLDDDWGRRVSLPAPPARIVSLAPHATELLFAGGAGSRVVAVDRSSRYPAAARALPRVTSHPQPDAEQLLALAPQLVVIWGPGASRAVLERLQALGIAVFVSEPRTLDDIAATLERFAQLSGDPAPGLAAARRFRERLASVRARYAGARPVRVFVQIWSAPLIGIADGDVIGDAVRSCAGVNVFADAPRVAPQLDAEAVIAAHPELVIATDGARSEQRWRQLGLIAPRGTARFAVFDASMMEVPGPRALDALEQLCVEIDTVRRSAR
ncbi:MAG: cobalamin-binding protein [Burkholderiaceae bacterium]|nr:cobalamin-binding protein [Burkholderiaceae bacterium]